MTDDELTAFRAIINGQMAAMRVVLMALIATHPDRQTLARLIGELEGQLTGTWLNTALPEDFFEAFRQLTGEFQKRCLSS